MKRIWPGLLIARFYVAYRFLIPIGSAFVGALSKEISKLIVVSLSLLFLATVLWNEGLLEDLTQVAVNRLQGAIVTPDPSLRPLVIGFDDQTLARMASPEETDIDLLCLVSNLSKAGAKVIGLDYFFIFRARDRSGEDCPLTGEPVPASFEDLGARIVVLSNIISDGGVRREVVPHENLIRSNEQQYGHGFLQLSIDRDVARSAELFIKPEPGIGQPLPSFGAVIWANAALGWTGAQLRSELSKCVIGGKCPSGLAVLAENEIANIRYLPTDQIVDSIPAYQIYGLPITAPDSARMSLSSLVNGRVVLIGNTSRSAIDVFGIPNKISFALTDLLGFRSSKTGVPGVFIHAHLLDNLLNERLVEKLGPLWNVVIVLSTALVVILLCITKPERIVAALRDHHAIPMSANRLTYVLVGAGVVAFAGSVYVLFVTGTVLIPISRIGLTICLTGLIISTYLVSVEAERQKSMSMLVTNYLAADDTYDLRDTEVLFRTSTDCHLLALTAPSNFSMFGNDTATRLALMRDIVREALSKAEHPKIIPLVWHWIGKQLFVLLLVRPQSGLGLKAREAYARDCLQSITNFLSDMAIETKGFTWSIWNEPVRLLPIPIRGGINCLNFYVSEAFPIDSAPGAAGGYNGSGPKSVRPIAEGDVGRVLQALGSVSTTPARDVL